MKLNFIEKNGLLPDLLNFTKMHANGNDFVIIFCDFLPNLDKKFVIKLCDRNFGIGCDQLILIRVTDLVCYDAECIIYNNDGSLVSMCCNGLACVANLLSCYMNKQEIRIALAGKINVCYNKFSAKTVKIETQSPFFLSKNTDNTLLNISKILYDNFYLDDVFIINVGNTHFIKFIENAEDFFTHNMLSGNHKVFSGKLFSFHVAEVLDAYTIRIFSIERGAGVTKSCASGTSAVFFAALKSGLVSSKTLNIESMGGVIKVEYDNSGKIHLNIETSIVFEGLIKSNFDNNHKIFCNLSKGVS